MRSRARIALAACALLLAPQAAAQSPIMRPKQQAQRAVAATNAHTQAMTDTTAGSTTKVGPAGAAGAAASSRSETSAPSPRSAGTAALPNEDTTRARVSTSKGTTAKPERATFEREIFSYERAGRRDPFVSLMTTGDIRPLIADLRLVGIAYDPSGRSSVAVLREDAQEQRATGATRGSGSTTDAPQYRVKEGQQIGRMRVARIGSKSVTFTIEEFGYSRQETLTLDSNTEKKP